MPNELDWWSLIDKRAALREQRPNLRRLLNERPGCAADNARQATYREITRLRIEAEQHARWEASIDANTTRRAKNQQRAANAAYNAHRRTTKGQAA